ncbi:MAG: T9SS type A sorting domain-containing protein [Ignavibacteria bacterium]|nr:T9SS type A sorting domain-containing protein [Ignavibacteria bacterium]
MKSFSFRTHYSFSLSFLLIFIFNLNSSMAQECGECSRPRVALYDFAINVPRPSEADAIMQYLKLFFVGPYARGSVKDQYPYGSCISFLDGAMVNASDLQGDTLRFGPEYSNLPPAGAVESADYILTGEVTGSNGSYTAMISLEAAWSREVVASGRLPFTLSAESAPIQSVGIGLAEKISPLLSIIRNFELEKRNSDTKVAIRDISASGSKPEIEIKPSKKDPDVNETIDVEIKMIDCDGVPLKNREILFEGNDYEGNPLDASTGGKFEVKSVVTDESGTAKVKFTTGSQQTTGILHAYYVHEKPSGRPAMFIGTELINVKQPPVKYWKFNAQFSESRTYQCDTSWSNEYFAGRSSEQSSSFAGGHVSAILENISDSSAFFNYDNAVRHPLSVNGSGNYSEFSTSKSFEYITGKLNTADVRNDRVSGNASITKEISLFLDFNDSTESFTLDIGYPGKASYNGKLFGIPPEGGDLGWRPYAGDGEGGGAVDFSFSSTPGTHVSRSDSGYAIKYSETENSTEYTSGGKAYVTVRKNLSAFLAPYDKTTGVEEKLRHGIPDNYSLEQNYPNPFNPSTKIRYSLPERAFVTLKVYDVLGSEIASLVNGEKTSGNYEVEFDASKLTSGIYIYRIQAGKFTSAKKLLLVK